MAHHGLESDRMEQMARIQREGTGELLARSERDRLLLEHLPLVHHVARQMLRRRNLDLELDDLVSAGTLGLMEALEKFDASRGLAVSTFATPRIQGAILDELRRRDPLGRTSRRRVREIAEARESLAQELGRAPEDRDVARRLGVPAEQIATWERDALGAETVPLDRPVVGSASTAGARGGSGGGRALASESVADDSILPAELLLERREQARILGEELSSLPERERLVLTLYYFEELKLHEIATVLGVTESRISQIRTKATRTLRDRMQPRLGLGPELGRKPEVAG
ncbi:MAG: FliA/WhiG family RNA polymerase sigma factor [Gemmatimonadales bacterium]|nr:MAG: FliA/WhiG family RNA polymerase sigma factor [Gemmatimonadales bacterium]